jgi:serine/threonine-protein kinase RsbW
MVQWQTRVVAALASASDYWQCCRVELRIANSREQMRLVSDRLEQFGAEHRLSASVVHDLNVVLDEALSNIIGYGYPAGALDEIIIRMFREPKRIVMEIEDGAVPFDPLQAAKPDLDAALGERKIGGVGVHFIKSLTDDVSYHRIGNRNCLRLIKKLDLG